MFRKFQISNRLPNRYFPKFDVGLIRYTSCFADELTNRGRRRVYSLRSWRYCRLSFLVVPPSENNSTRVFEIVFEISSNFERGGRSKQFMLFASYFYGKVANKNC